MSEDWTEKPIGSYMRLLSGFPFPSSGFTTSEGFPLIRIRDIINSSIETYFLGKFEPQYIVQKGDVLVGMDGDFNIRKWKNSAALLNQRILKVGTLDPSELDEGFLFYWLQPFLQHVNVITAATTVKHLSVKDLRSAKTKLPSAPIQTKIGNILQTIDEAIEQTEALIEKYSLVKAGMMHDLFARGLTPDGKLRPPREEAPDLYKETPIGWIPKEWDWGDLENYCSRICVGIVIRPADYYVTEGVPTFRSANVRESGITDSDLVYISAKSNAMLHKSQVRKGDILTVRTGYPGISAVVPEKYDGCNCVDILISTPTGSISSEFLCYWINSSFGKGQVLSGQGGLAQQHFNVGEMRELIVVKPCEDEQSEITKRFDAVEAKIETQQELLKKYKLQKFGLMNDLLTGVVPVNVDEPEAGNV